MDKISPNFVYNMHLFDNSRLGFLPVTFCLFVKELWPLTDVTILFLVFCSIYLELDRFT